MQEDDFRKLQKFWYKKLKQAGFKDLESFTQDGRDLPLLSAWYSKDVFVAKDQEDYYRAAGKFYWDYPWVNPLHKRFWKLHAEGIPTLHIRRKLKLTDFSTRKLLAFYQKLMLDDIYERRTRSRRNNKKNLKYNSKRDKEDKREESKPVSRHSRIQTFGLLFTFGPSSG